MDIVAPGIGLIFWSSLLFLSVLLILGKVAFKPIAAALKNREEEIEKALSASSQAKQEVDALKSEIEKMKKEARAEREQMLKEAKENASKIVTEAQEKAKDEYNRILGSAQAAIQNEKRAAVADMRKQAATLSLEIAEKVLRTQLSNDEAQRKLVSKFLDEASAN